MKEVKRKKYAKQFKSVFKGKLLGKSIVIFKKKNLWQICPNENFFLNGIVNSFEFRKNPLNEIEPLKPTKLGYLIGF